VAGGPARRLHNQSKTLRGTVEIDPQGKYHLLSDKEVNIMTATSTKGTYSDVSLEENKALAKRWTTGIWDTGNMEAALAAVEEIISPDFVDHALPQGFPPGVEGLKLQIKVFYTAFPDIHAKVDDVLAEGDKVVVRWSGGGTSRGEFFGIPPTGRSGTTTGIHIMRVAGGKIVEHWSNSDDLGLMQQLGILPSMG
jgi:predicted ester cyclase